jgi:hypothetical protein
MNQDILLFVFIFYDARSGEGEVAKEEWQK